MTRASRLVGTLLIAMAAAASTACSDRGDLNISNNGPAAVTVSTGDEEVVVDADGGAAILDYGCTPGDVTVSFESGSEVVLPGPVCSDQQIVVGDGTATLQAAGGGSS
jgi:hypothetical protein